MQPRSRLNKCGKKNDILNVYIGQQGLRKIRGKNLFFKLSENSQTINLPQRSRIQRPLVEDGEYGNGLVETRESNEGDFHTKMKKKKKNTKTIIQYNF